MIVTTPIHCNIDASSLNNINPIIKLKAIDKNSRIDILKEFNFFIE